MGGGFYDRTLSGISGPLLVGLAHENQHVDEIPLENWDIALDYVATDVGLHTLPAKGVVSVLVTRPGAKAEPQHYVMSRRFQASLLPR